MKTRRLLLVLLCAYCFTKHTDGARILGLFPLQGKSHFIMFQALMEALADAGHQVDVVSHFPQEKPYANYTDIINLAGTLPHLLNNMTYEMMQTFVNPSPKMITNMAGISLCNLMELPELQKLIKNPPTDPPYDLVLAEFFFASCYFAFGRHLGVPVVALSSVTPMFHTNAPFGNPANTAIVCQLQDCPVTPMSFWQRLQNTIMVSYMSGSARYYMEAQNEIVKKHFGPDMPDIEELERELSLYLVNSHHIFHGIRPLTPAVVEVAGLHVRDDETPIATDLRKWSDDSKDGFIYFSLGSMVKIESFPKSTLSEIYSAFAKISPIRVLMKVANPEELPPGLPDNVLVLTWVPQVKILKHKNIRGFLTHGGLMGLQEAVTFGVPLIGVPLFGDQLSNVKICVERGIAVSLDYKNLKADGIVGAVNSVVYDPKYKNNMNAVSKQFLDRPTSARTTAVFWIEYILKHGGDGLRSPAVKLTWWQLALLDVYGAMLAAVLVTIYVSKLLLSAIITRIFYPRRNVRLAKKQN